MSFFDYNEIIDKGKGILTVDHLHEDRDERKRLRYQTYDKILEQCQTRICNISRFNKDDCHFTIPSFVMGYPRFNKKACLTYIYFKLQKGD